MERNQADVVSDAILDPKLKELEANKDRKLKEQRRLKTQRKIGSFAILGLAIGYSIGLYLQENAFIYGLIGFSVGVTGAFVVSRLCK